MCNLAVALRRLGRNAARVVRAAAHAVTRVARAVWTAHRTGAASNVAYSAAVAAVVGGLLGFVAPRDVIAAVLTALLGVSITRGQQPKAAGRVKGFGQRDERGSGSVPS